jgi:hypothetical protein
LRVQDSRGYLSQKKRKRRKEGGREGRKEEGKMKMEEKIYKSTLFFS